MAQKQAEIQLLTEFLMDYTLTMLSLGSYTSRAIACVKRIGEAFGYEVYISIFSKTINISVIALNDYTKSKTFVRSYKDSAISFDKIALLSALSWHAYDDKITFTQLQENYHKIIKRGGFSFWSYLALQGFAFAAFCRLFGGDIGAMGSVFIATLIGVSLRKWLIHIRLDLRLVFVVCAFVASMTAYIGKIIGLTQTPDVAIGSSVLFLIPGIYLINGVIDILDGHSLNGISRIIRVIILISCIAIGLYATLSFSNIRMEY